MIELKNRYMWGATGKRLYHFLDTLEKTGLEKTLVVVGCSDGAEVIPAANRGFTVTAIDKDSTALYGGKVEISGQEVAIKGLRHWIETDGLEDRIDIVEGNIMDLSMDRTFTGVMASGLLHYQENSKFKLEDIVEKIKTLVSLNGILLLEYIHVGKEKNNDPERHFLTKIEVENFFGDGWRIRSNKVKDYTDLPNPRNPFTHTTTWGRLYVSRQLPG